MTNPNMTKSKEPELLYRQGDLLLRRVFALPENLRPRQSEILAEGETTGHRHRLVGQAQILDGEDGEYLRVNEKSVLVHEEHNEVKLDAGFYKVIHEREFDPFEELEKRVTD